MLDSSSKLKGKSIKDIYFYLYDYLNEYVKEKKYINLVTKKEKKEKIEINKFILKSKFCNIKLEKHDYYLEKKYIEHYFNLLGSGWIKNSYDVLENTQSKYDKKFICDMLNDEHKDYAKNIFDYMQSGIKEFNLKYSTNYSYNPIDWQKDFISSYKFDVKKWYKDIQWKCNSGYDIKVPWELARGQHLIHLCKMVICDNNQMNILEIKNQILDFIMMNPCGYGVNWVCSMDVAIRIVNYIIAIELVRDFDEDSILDEKFDQLFANSVYEHARHIYNNLENRRGYKGNHYLSNISGLIFASSYLKSNNETNKWLYFSIIEMYNAIDDQFNDDGSNFEASTAYHRLSCEIVTYSIAVICRIISTERGKEIIDKILKKKRIFIFKRMLRNININSPILISSRNLIKVFNSLQFLKDVTKYNGEMFQVGDNDSGRFVKFNSFGELISVNTAYNKYENLKNIKIDIKDFWDENELITNETIDIMSALLENKNYNLATSFINLLKGDIDLFNDIEFSNKIKNEYNMPEELEFKEKTVIKFYKSINLDNLIYKSYDDFGVYIFKSDELFLGISAGNNGQNGIGGHGHNDKLAFELSVLGKDIVKDKGSYTYTKDVNMRNKFRSTHAHSTIIINNEEQNFISDTKVFWLPQETTCSLIYKSNNEITLKCRYREYIHIRKFIIKEDRLIVEDSCNKNFKVNIYNDCPISNGYGKILI